MYRIKIIWLSGVYGIFTKKADTIADALTTLFNELQDFGEIEEVFWLTGGV